MRIDDDEMTKIQEIVRNACERTLPLCCARLIPKKKQIRDFIISLTNIYTNVS